MQLGQVLTNALGGYLIKTGNVVALAIGAEFGQIPGIALLGAGGEVLFTAQIRVEGGPLFSKRFFWGGTRDNGLGRVGHNCELLTAALSALSANAANGGAANGSAPPQYTLRTKCPCWSGSSRSEEHTSELQSRGHIVCCLLLEKKKYIFKNN